MNHHHLFWGYGDFLSLRHRLQQKIFTVQRRNTELDTAAGKMVIMARVNTSPLPSRTREQQTPHHPGESSSQDQEQRRRGK